MICAHCFTLKQSCCKTISCVWSGSLWEQNWRCCCLKDCCHWRLLLLDHPDWRTWAGFFANPPFSSVARFWECLQPHLHADFHCTLEAKWGGQGRYQGWREAGPRPSVSAQGAPLDLNFPYCSLSSEEVAAHHSTTPPPPTSCALCVCLWLVVCAQPSIGGAEGSEACCILLPLLAGFCHPYLSGLMRSRYICSH